MEENARANEARLSKILRGFSGAAVAFSGGVDSAVLLKAAKDALGNRAVAVTAVSALMSAEETEAAKALAAEIGARHVILPTPDLENPAFAANDKERCYYCKKARFEALTLWAQNHGCEMVLEGSNADDGADYRPGMRALAELSGVASPLAAAGLGKREIRDLAKFWGLSVWNKPSAACLASRLSYGLEITKERLRQVELAETALEKIVGGQARVRHHGDLARIEVDARDLALFAQENARDFLVRELKKLGFVYVALDLQGYRTGSQNEAIDTR